MQKNIGIHLRILPQHVLIPAWNIPTFWLVPFASCLDAQGTLWRHWTMPKASPAKACAMCATTVNYFG